MPNLSKHHSQTTTKMLYIGDSGSGKTGSLAALAAAGYNLRIIDLDNGLDILRNLLLSSASPYPKSAIERVEFETLTDPMKKSPNGKLIPYKATVWQRLMGLLDNWKTESAELGPISEWTDKDVLIIDSLTTLSTAAMNFVLSMNNRLGQPPQQSDWYAGQQLVESLLQMLYDEGVGCNVIMICHIVYIGEDNGPQRGYPASLGKALSPKIGRYFNSALMARSSGIGSNVKRRIITQPTALVELKNSSPFGVQPEYPLESGLADYFRDLRNPDGASKGVPTTTGATPAQAKAFSTVTK